MIEIEWYTLIVPLISVWKNQILEEECYEDKLSGTAHEQMF